MKTKEGNSVWTLNYKKDKTNKLKNKNNFTNDKLLLIILIQNLNIIITYGGVVQCVAHVSKASIINIKNLWYRDAINIFK